MHIIRIINKSHFNAHTDPIFKELGTLKSNDIHLLQLANLSILAKIHSYLQGSITISPKAMNSTLIIQEIPRPTVCHAYCPTSTKKFFNSLENQVINSKSLPSFGKILKIKLLCKYENQS